MGECSAESASPDAHEQRHAKLRQAEAIFSPDRSAVLELATNSPCGYAGFELFAPELVRRKPSNVNSNFKVEQRFLTQTIETRPLSELLLQQKQGLSYRLALQEGSRGERQYISVAVETRCRYIDADSTL